MEALLQSIQNSSLVQPVKDRLKCTLQETSFRKPITLYQNKQTNYIQTLRNLFNLLQYIAYLNFKQTPVSQTLYDTASDMLRTF